MHFLDSSGYVVGELGYHGTDDNSVHLGSVYFMRMVHHHELHLQLITCPVRLRINNPGNITVVVIKQSETDIGIADVYYNRSQVKIG